MKQIFLLTFIVVAVVVAIGYKLSQPTTIIPTFTDEQIEFIIAEEGL